MTRRVLLVEIGTPAGLPVVTPPAPRPPSAWVPDPRPSPGLPPPTGLAAVSVADAAVLSWTRSTAGGQTIVEAAPDVAGVPGIWREVRRVGGDTYTISLPGGPRWVRVRAELNGRMSVATNAVLAEPVDVSGSISEFEQELRDIADLVDAVAAQAAADAAALNLRADDLRDDLDEAIADVSTLTDVTDGLGTEITRVENESVARDTATVETISLLGAKNGAGTAFILDGNTLRMAPDQTLAQWRSSIQGEFASQSSRIDNEEQARQDGDQALATTLATVQATANNAATKAELTAAQSALAAADQALSERLDLTRAEIREGVRIANPYFEAGNTGWGAVVGDSTLPVPFRASIVRQTGNAYSGAYVFRVDGTPSQPETFVYNYAAIPVTGGEVLRVRVRTRTPGASPANAGATAQIGFRFNDADGEQVGVSFTVGETSDGNGWGYADGVIEGEHTVPSGTRFAYLTLRTSNLVSGAIVFDAVEGSGAGLDAEAIAANAQLINITRAEVEDHGDTLAAHTAQIATHTAEIADKASTTYVQSVEGIATAAQSTADDAAGQAAANLTAINSLTATAGDHTASINELREVSVSAASGNALRNPSFESSGSGWTLQGNGIDFPGVSSLANSGTRFLRFSGHSSGGNKSVFGSYTPAVAGRKYRLGGVANSVSATPGDAALVFHVRARRADGTFHSNNHGYLTIPRSDLTGSYKKFEHIWTAPAQLGDIADITLQISANNMGTDSAAAFRVDDVFLEPVSESLADVLARYSLAVTAGGDVAGMQLLAGGGTSAIRFLADMFSIVSPSGDGMTLENGTQWNRRGNYSMISGPALGGDMLLYIGPTPSSPGAASKADALMFVDSAGDAYFAGRVLQGVLRWFTSTDSTASNASVSTGSNPRLGKSVSLAVRYSFGESWVYLGGTVTPGSGITRVTVQIQRRYGSGAWTTLTTRDIQGVSHAYNNPGSGDPSSWNSTISGEVFASDSASTNNSEYRALISGRTVQSHSGGTSPQPVVRTQYLSIEAME